MALHSFSFKRCWLVFVAFLFFFLVEIKASDGTRDFSDGHINNNEEAYCLGTNYGNQSSLKNPLYEFSNNEIASFLFLSLWREVFS